MEYKEWYNKKLDNIKKHPERHNHSFIELQACCLFEGTIDSALMDAHSEYIDLGTNGGVKCDTTSGPCSCGGYH